jgi:hypothetical protein
MDTHAKQDSLDRRDHPPELRARNAAAAEENLSALTNLDPRINCALLRGNICETPVTAIVNAANETLQGGGGVDESIHAGAGFCLFVSFLFLLF